MGKVAGALSKRTVSRATRASRTIARKVDSVTLSNRASIPLTTRESVFPSKSFSPFLVSSRACREALACFIWSLFNRAAAHKQRRAQLGAPGKFGMAFRRTTGVVESLLRLIGLDLTVPDDSTPSRRQKALVVNIPNRGSHGPLTLLVDSTGIKAKGEG